MLSIIIAFPRVEDTKNIKNLLVRNGFEVSATCTSGAQVISTANELDEGIVLCGYRFSDMQYIQLNNYLPKGFEMLLVASPAKIDEVGDSNIVCLSTPIKANELLNTIQMITQNYNRRKKKIRERMKDKPNRSVEEKATINKVKMLLMDKNNMSEEEAHRYIQKTSMDSGTNMVETAEMLLALMQMN